MVGRLWELCRGIHCTAAQSEAYRQAWDNPPPRPGRPACRHLGEAIRQEECPTCTGRVRLKVFACALHDACTTHKALTNVACCADCLDYQPKE
jgi:hypothetical protein